MVATLERKRHCPLSRIKQRAPMLPITVLDRCFHIVRGGPIRQHHEPKTKIFMNVPPHERIHLVTPRTDGGYVFLG
jgi:hypothetical protein